MDRRSARRSARRVSPLLAALAAGLVSLAPAAARPVAAAEELRVAAATTYVLDPDAGVVRVAIDVTVTNLKPDRVQGNLVTSYFWDRLAFGIHGEAGAVRATGSGRTLTVTREAEDGYASLTVRLANRLDYRETHRFRIQYDLPGGEPRSFSPIRVGNAFASFYAWAWGDPGRASVTIQLPAGFEDTTNGADLVESRVDGGIRLVAEAIEDPQEWYVTVDAERPSRLTRDPLVIPGGARITVHAWPEDEEWRTKVSDLMEDGLPVLQDLIGLDWPVAGELGVYEVHTPLLEGYAGVYYTDRDRIEIGEDLDDLTIIHEASHAWFNDDLFSLRWITEGMADEYAALVLEELGRPRPRPDRPDLGDRAAVPLNSWFHPGRIVDDATDAREAYGYNTSWYLLSELIDEIGVAAMRDVFEAADEDLAAYRGAPAPETVPGRDDWKRFLDLLEEVGGSVDAPKLFEAWVINKFDRQLLDERAEARSAYAELLEAADGWLAPWAIRSELEGWEFGRAQVVIGDAMELLEAREVIAGRADALGLATTDRLETAYELARSDLEEAESVAVEEAASLDALEAARAALDRERDALTSLGLWNEAPPETRWDAAVAAFEADDHETTVAEADAASAMIDGAADVGRSRATTAGAGAGTGILVLGGTVLVFRRRRGRRARQATALGSAATAPASVALAGDADPGVSDETLPYATLAPQPPAPEPTPEARAEPAPRPAAPDEGGSDPP